MPSEPTPLVVLPPQTELTRRWAQRLSRDVPEVSVIVADDDVSAAGALTAGAPAAFGALGRALLHEARDLRWLQAPMAAPPAGFFYSELTEHPVVVTNLRGTYSDHVATHAVAMLLALSRNLPTYAKQQAAHRWVPIRDAGSVLHLPEAVVLIVGLGAIGIEIARMLAPFGCTVIGIDAKPATPPPLVSEVGGPERLDDFLRRADAVILTVPHTPQTENLIDEGRLSLMKPDAVLVNVGRGAVVDIDALAQALRRGGPRGAALDVFPTEPLSETHPLWDAPGVVLTPHVAAVGPYTEDRRYAVLRDNARRFVAGDPLINVVDKAAWF